MGVILGGAEAHGRCTKHRTAYVADRPASMREQDATERLAAESRAILGGAAPPPGRPVPLVKRKTSRGVPVHCPSCIEEAALALVSDLLASDEEDDNECSITHIM